MNSILMLEQNLIDLSITATPSDMLQEITDILEQNDLKGKKVKLVLGDISLTPAQVLSIKAILSGAGVEIELIYSTSIHTQLAALGAGLAVSEQIPFSDTPAKSVETRQNELLDQLTAEQALEDALEKELYENKDNKESKDNRVKTLYLKQNFRSGQSVSFDGNIVIIGDCHPGSEITATGDITVWGIFSGIAHAGAKGNQNACIRALRINAIQLRIADLFSRRPDKLEVEKMDRTNTFTPEEARIFDGEIIIYSYDG